MKKLIIIAVALALSSCVTASVKKTTKDSNIVECEAHYSSAFKTSALTQMTACDAGGKAEQSGNSLEMMQAFIAGASSILGVPAR